MISWLQAQGGGRMPSTPLAIDGLTWLAAVGLLILAKQLPSYNVLNIAQVGWTLSGVGLTAAAVLWFKHSMRVPALYTLGLGIVALCISIQCYFLYAKIRTIRKSAKNTGDDKEQLNFDPQQRLDLLRISSQKIDSVAWLLAGFFLVSLFSAAKVQESGFSVSTTVVTAILGFLASAVSTRITTEPIFSNDKLRVFSSTAGTQFICPIELLLVKDTATEIETIGETFKLLTAKRNAK